MPRAGRFLVLATLVAVAPALAGCADFDTDKLDIFHLTDKKKLPGERKELFPGGVPGVAQGVPPQYLQGYQPPTENADVLPEGSKVNPGDEDAAAAMKSDSKTAAVTPAEVLASKAKSKPKPKPKAATAKKPAPTRVTTQPASPAQSPWPAAPNQQQQSAQSPWPAASGQAQQQPAAQTPWHDPKSSPDNTAWPSQPANSQ